MRKQPPRELSSGHGNSKNSGTIRPLKHRPKYVTTKTNNCWCYLYHEITEVFQPLKIISFRKEWNVGRIKADCQNIARRLMDMPSNKMTPNIFSSVSDKILLSFVDNVILTLRNVQHPPSFCADGLQGLYSLI